MTEDPEEKRRMWIFEMHKTWYPLDYIQKKVFELFL